LLVFSGHVFIQQLQGGLVVVDLFFVLSGYLITALLLKEYAKTGSISLRRFYTRRMLRLYPALVAVVIVTFVLAEVDHIAHPIPDSAAALLYVTNFWRQFHQHGNYISLVVNTWSLGIEEQFYLCLPVILIVALRRQWSLITVAVTSMFACFALTGAAYHAHPSFVPVLAWLPFAPGPELASGALLAVLQTRTKLINLVRRAVGWPVAVASIVLIVVVSFHGTYRWWMFGGVTLIAWPLIAHLVLAPEGWLSRAFSFRPAVWLGERSYAFYLLHLPVLVLLSRSVHSYAGLLLIGLPLSLMLTQLSWVCVEQRFLRIKVGFATPGVAVASAPEPTTDQRPRTLATVTSWRDSATALANSKSTHRGPPLSHDASPAPQPGS
jgi:peptidoglycan/LPS O-acetylase OafA/YrhL